MIRCTLQVTDDPFADTRTAYEDLDTETKTKIIDWVIGHSQHQSRRKASPGEPLLQEARVSRLPFTAGTAHPSSTLTAIPLVDTSLFRRTSDPEGP